MLNGSPSMHHALGYFLLLIKLSLNQPAIIRWLGHNLWDCSQAVVVETLAHLILYILWMLPTMYAQNQGHVLYCRTHHEWNVYPTELVLHTYIIIAGPWKQIWYFISRDQPGQAVLVETLAHPTPQPCYVFCGCYLLRIHKTNVMSSIVGHTMDELPIPAIWYCIHNYNWYP